MDRQWLYPYYVIAILALILFFFGCDSEGGEAFSVEVQVENDEGGPIEGATVGVRPCYDVGEDVWCSDKLHYSSAEASEEGKAVELAAWDVRVDGRDALLAWTTASESNNAGFQIEGKRGNEDFDELGFVDGQGTTAEPTDYRYRVEELIGEEHTFRLSAVTTDGTSSVVGEPETVRISTSFDFIVRSFPNPVQRQAVFEVAVTEASVIKSGVYTLDGEKIQTLIQEEIPARETYQYRWNAGDKPAGVYEHRTQIRTNGDVAARDTSYVAVTGMGELGKTGMDGTASMTDRTRFPALYDVPTMELRDGDGVTFDTMRVSPTVEFVVTTEEGQQTFRRTVSEGENTLTLSVSP